MVIYQQLINSQFQDYNRVHDDRNNDCVIVTFTEIQETHWNTLVLMKYNDVTFILIRNWLNQ